MEKRRRGGPSGWGWGDGADCNRRLHHWITASLLHPNNRCHCISYTQCDLLITHPPSPHPQFHFGQYKCATTGSPNALIINKLRVSTEMRRIGFKSLTVLQICLEGLSLSTHKDLSRWYFLLTFFSIITFDPFQLHHSSQISVKNLLCVYNLSLSLLLATSFVILNFLLTNVTQCDSLDSMSDVDGG